jgi:hypothetical protein
MRKVLSQRLQVAEQFPDKFKFNHVLLPSMFSFDLNFSQLWFLDEFPNLSLVLL